MLKYIMWTKYKILTPDMSSDVPFVQILTISPKICPALLWLLFWQIHFEKTSQKQFFEALMLIWCEKLVFTAKIKCTLFVYNTVGGCIVNCFMLSSLPCSAIPTSCYIFITYFLVPRCCLKQKSNHIMIFV